VRTRYNLEFPHYLTKIIDARGNQVARNLYDELGRLIASQLRTPLNEGKLAYSNSTPKRLAHLVALSRLTREGPRKLFHSDP